MRPKWRVVLLAEDGFDGERAADLRYRMETRLPGSIVYLNPALEQSAGWMEGVRVLALVSTNKQNSEAELQALVDPWCRRLPGVPVLFISQAPTPVPVQCVRTCKLDDMADILETTVCLAVRKRGPRYRGRLVAANQVCQLA
jgi:hypothetical protein